MFQGKMNCYSAFHIWEKPTISSPESISAAGILISTEECALAIYFHNDQLATMGELIKCLEELKEKMMKKTSS